jgi:hypothetical protein
MTSDADRIARLRAEVRAVLDAQGVVLGSLRARLEDAIRDSYPPPVIDEPDAR